MQRNPKTIKKPQKAQAIYLLASRRSRPLLEFVVVYHDHLRFLFAKNLNGHWWRSNRK